MPPLGGPGPRRVNAGAVKRRARAVARIPKPPAPKPQAPPNFPRAVPKRPGQIVTAVPKAHIRPTAPAQRGPTPAQLRQSRIAEQQYKSQAGAVRRAAKTQKTTGPGVSARPVHGTVLHQADIDRASRESQSLKQEAAYAYTPKQTATNVMPAPAALRKAQEKGYLRKDYKAAGFAPPGALEKAISAPKYAIKYGVAPAVKDFSEIVAGTVPSLVHLGVGEYKAGKKSVETRSAKPLAKQQVEVAKEVAKPYIESFKHPVKAVTEHPVSTFLMFAPTAKVPLRLGGRATRLAGKQTLVRSTGELPGTALKEVRTGSRDIVSGPIQGALKRREARTPEVTVKEVKRRVDEHHDLAQHHEQEAVVQAVKTSRKHTKGQPRHVRDEHAARAAQNARDQAHIDSQARFAQEFGANVHPEIPASAVDAAAADRVAAGARRIQTKKAVTKAEKAHAKALGNARAARGRTPARSGGGVALATKKPGVPPAQADALLKSIHDLDAAKAEHAVARAEHGAAKQAHIDVKQAHRESALVNPAGEGRLFEHERDAKTVAKQLNAQAHEIPTGGLLPAQLHVRETGAESRPVTATRGAGTQPLTFRVRKIGEGDNVTYAVLPKVASQRMYGGGGKTADLSHASVGTSKSTIAKLMRSTRGAFTQAVLPLNVMKWLTGQGVEAGIRSAVAGAGPADLLRFKRIVKKMNADHPGAGDDFARRVTGGQYGKTGAVAQQLKGSGKTYAEEFQGTPLRAPAALATLVGQAAPLRAVRGKWAQYTNLVMSQTNGLIENTARKAMAGHAIKHGPLMERRLHGLTDAAIKDAADGLHGTENQLLAAREVAGMYGKYSQWSPEMRSLMMHWTPFLPWYLNTAKFLAYTLPAKHPLKTSLLASTVEAEQDWRESQRLSFYGKHHRPDFLMGSYPAKGGGAYRVSHYTPFGAGTNIGEMVSDLLIPQLLGPVKNLAGVDWRWQRLKNPDRSEFTPTQNALRAGATLLEGQIPGVSQAGKLSGVTPRYIDRKKNVPKFSERAKSYLPTTATPGPPGASSTPGGFKVTPYKIKPYKIKPWKLAS